MPGFVSTKTYGHELGLSACFRQWRAQHSHCSKLHGYALSVKLMFSCLELDDKNWVVDFGGMKDVKKFLQDTFDHKTLVAKDDPHFNKMLQLHDSGAIDMVPMENVGCEAFAKFIFEWTEKWLVKRTAYGGRVELLSVEVREHGANSAIYHK